MITSELLQAFVADNYAAIKINAIELNIIAENENFDAVSLSTRIVEKTKDLSEQQRMETINKLFSIENASFLLAKSALGRRTEKSIGGKALEHFKTLDTHIQSLIQLVLLIVFVYLIFK